MTDKVVFEGKEDGVPCGRNVTLKVWKQGHSFKCEKKTSVRYWQPDNYFSELADFCKYCKEASNV